uniref:SSD domain-containing protein n=1 Tax=Syphacia muris TaxID=451379 RepID=A0A0N5AXW8_9BILA
MQLPVTARDDGNLLRDRYLEEVENLSNYLQFNFTVPCNLTTSGKCAFRDVCYGPCNDNQVIPIFRFIYRNASQRLHPNFRLTYPTMHIYNDDYYTGENFAGVSVNKKTNRIRWESKLLKFATTFKNQLINISCSSDGMFSSEVRRNGMTCVPYFALSVLIVFFFIYFTCQDSDDFTLKFKDYFLIALFGTLSPLLAIVTTFNLLWIIGLPFNSITLVVPFLIMGVGCDDTFIIVHAWRRINRSCPSHIRIAKTIEEAGPSITVTSLTNVLSFGIGALTGTLAIQIFCIYAAVGVLLDFIYQVTFFAAATVYEGRRLSTVAPATSDVQKQQNSSSKNRLILFLILIAYWGVSIYGFVKMEVKMDSTNLILKDSPLNNVAWIYERYLWRQGSLVIVFVNNPPELSSVKNQSQILEMVNRFETLQHSMGRNSTSIWLRSFLTQAQLHFINEDENFYQALENWLKDEENGGNRWNEMIHLKYQNGTVVGIDKFMFATASLMGEHASWTLRSQLQRNWRSLAKEYPQFNVTVFQPYSFYVDQLDSIRTTTFGTVTVALLTMAVTCLLLIPSATSIFSSSLAMVSINIGVFGGLSLWSVYLDPLTMCTTLMGIGFSVDFTAHISFHFYRSPSTEDPVVRLAGALRSIGWPMIQAGSSTILCVAPLLIVNSYLANVFVKTIVLVISLGLIHGILFLPVFLLSTRHLMDKKKKSAVLQQH